MFHGTYEHQIDSKGRLSIPAKFRAIGMDGMITQFVMIRGIGGCLSLLRAEVFKHFQDEYKPNYPTFKAFLDYKRLFLPRSVPVSVDPQGRIIIPTELKTEVEIDDRALIIGVGEWIEIWNPDKFKEYCDNLKESYDKMAEDFFSALSGFQQPKEKEEINDSTSAGDG